MKTTRNTKGAGGIRQRPDGRWEARYTAGYDLRTGKQKRGSVYGKTKRECQTKLNKVLAELDSGTFFEPAKVTVGEWLDIWTSEYLGGVKPRTVDLYKGVVKARIKPGVGALKLDALTPHAVQSYYNGLSKEGLAPKTVKNIHGILSHHQKRPIWNTFHIIKWIAGKWICLLHTFPDPG